MPLLRSSTRPTPVQCFFCLSTKLLPPHSSDSFSSDRKGKSRISEVGTKWNWQCDRCGCWNIKDERGEMISDLPAMHDTSYNEHSFNLRAKPSSSHLPSSSSSSSTSPFCHNCLSNQTLIMNMLANYLPDDDDPSYPQLYAELPTYLAKLHSRYPPVCRNCQPAVDEALRKSDHRAQVQAWSSALNRGAGSTQATGGPNSSVRGLSKVDVMIWRIKGALWIIGIGLSVGQGVLASGFPYRLQEIINVNPPALPLVPLSVLCFHALSFLWITWDPYWLPRMRNRDKVKVEGKNVWIRNMLLISLLRLIGSTAAFFLTQGEDLSYYPLKLIQAVFAAEIALLTHSFLSIRISKPVSIKLVRPVSLTSPPTNPQVYSVPPHPSSPTNNGISPLSFSNQAPAAYTKNQNMANPIFGQPSLHQPIPEPQVEGEPMDWEPTIQQQRQFPLTSPDDDNDFQLHSQKKDNWDTFGLGKQRMFHNQNETGLENLLAGWGIGGNSNNNNDNGFNQQATYGNASNSNFGSKQGLNMFKPQDNAINLENIIKYLGIALVAIRMIGSGVISTITMTNQPDTSNISQMINRWLLITEAFNTTAQCFIHFQHNRNSNQNTNTPISLNVMVKISWSIFDFILRHVILMSNSALRNDGGHWGSIWSGLSEQNRQSLEWLGWGWMDLLSLWVG